MILQKTNSALFFLRCWRRTKRRNNHNVGEIPLKPSHSWLFALSYLKIWTLRGPRSPCRLGTTQWGIRCVFLPVHFGSSSLSWTKAASVHRTLDKGAGVGGPRTEMWGPVRCFFLRAPPASFMLSHLKGRMCYRPDPLPPCSPASSLTPWAGGAGGGKERQSREWGRAEAAR